MSRYHWLRSLLSCAPCTPARRHSTRLGIESLEAREVPATLSVADVSVREGPAAIGILDPAGAASVGLSGTRGMTFDTNPTDAHYGDLFVTGYLSHSVARFDWATQTYQPFVTPNSGGLTEAFGVVVGPDGNVYVADLAQSIIFRYDGSTGSPLPAPGQTGAVYANPGVSGALTGNIAFGPDGNLYANTGGTGIGGTGQILEYQGPVGSSPGAFMRVFATVGNGGHTGSLAFGPDGNLYVCVDSLVPDQSQVNRYDGSTGSPIGTGVFVPSGSGGLFNGGSIFFDPQGANMYVTGMGGRAGGQTRQVMRYQGPTGQNPGAYVEASITSGQSGLTLPHSMVLDAAGNFYVSDRDTANVTRYAPSSQAALTVTLDAPSTGTVSVNYATTNGTALAGTDYTLTSGTLTFAPGVTTQTVSVPVTTVMTGGPTKAFTLNLSAASGASIADGQGVGSILNRQAKFFVADGGTPKTYQYGSGGTSEEISPEASGNTAPRGIASTAAGDKTWVVDANKNVYVYTNHGVLLGSWSAGSLNFTADVQGITVWGSDVWLVDAKQDRVYRYAGAANRLSGSQAATSNFALNSSNTSPKDLVTDGASIWVVNDSSTDKVFKYALSGSLLGSWTVNGGGGSPTGITLDPSGASQDLWVVDNATDKVYRYAGARSLTSGSAAAATTFALNPFNTNPQGIADPPPAGTPVAPGTTLNATGSGEFFTLAGQTGAATFTLAEGNTTLQGFADQPAVTWLLETQPIATSSAGAPISAEATKLPSRLAPTGGILPAKQGDLFPFAKATPASRTKGMARGSDTSRPGSFQPDLMTFHAVRV